MRGTEWRRWRPGFVLLGVALVLGVGGYAVWSQARPYLHGSNCEISTSRRAVPLDLEQAANAATIAGVAFRKALPERAVVIAYATAIQESHIRNLPGGDRDSVGIFQQRPSQGWGRVDQLRDPVYSTSKFFDGLVKVKDYLDRDLHDAAQQVQRSADGTAYAPHENRAKHLAEAYTGRRPGAVRCWFSPDKRTAPRRAEAVRALHQTFGTSRLPVTKGDERHVVQVPTRRIGWAVASWAVSHALGYGLTEVRYAGLHWKADAGHDGWTGDDDAPADRVIIR
ncbi:hypothetical protein [Thermomonospora umbrina]|uniref:Uncharacterized protein n=1 Tax=Thermomonospora umbrina TaxID=111806 RepID=A0A3D9SJ78_9ACTN|nr:hypothetical protein [Thermomonospora umbrina]REE95966.1 hypothetical protein DFJ69_1385 [Thermomonospora umbrina]